MEQRYECGGQRIMGYEFEKFGDWDTSMPYTVENQTAEQPKNAFPKNSELHFSMTLGVPPKPNVMFIVSPGRKDGKYATKFVFYRPKYYNRFQRFMYKLCFGIKIIQGDEVRREFL